MLIFSTWDHFFSLSKFGPVLTFLRNFYLTDTGEDSKLVHRRKRSKADASIFFFFCDVSERRVWLSAESKILAFTFERFRLYRLRNRKFDVSSYVLRFYSATFDIDQNLTFSTLLWISWPNVILNDLILCMNHLLWFYKFDGKWSHEFQDSRFDVSFSIQNLFPAKHAAVKNNTTASASVEILIFFGSW